MLTTLQLFLSILAFYFIFGTVTILRQIQIAEYWSIKNNVIYVLRLGGLHLLVGTVALLGSLPYLVTQTLGTAFLATVTAAVPIVVLTGKKLAFRYGVRLVHPTVSLLVAASSGSVILPLLAAILTGNPVVLSVWFGVAVGLGLITAGRITSSTDSIPDSETHQDDAQNVIVCMVDDVRRDRMSLYGYDRKTTPFLESIGEQAYVFENCCSPGVRSGHSIPSLLSGTYATTHEYGNNIDNLRLISEEFEEAGYITGAVSGNPHVSSDRFQDRFNWFSYISAGKQYLFVIQRLLTRLRSGLDIGFLPVYYSLVEIEFIHELSQGFISDCIERDRPFFLYLNYMDVHDPYVRDLADISDFAAEHGEDLERPSIRSIDTSDRPALWFPDEIKSWGYDESIHHVDRNIAELYRFLEAKGVRDETTVIITSDHGELLGENGYWGHIDIPFNPLFEVPLIVDTPGTERLQSDTLVSSVSLPSLLLDVADIEPSREFREQLAVDPELTDLIDTDEQRWALVDFYNNAVDTKRYNHPEFGEPVGLSNGAKISRQRLLVTDNWKLYQMNDRQLMYEYGDRFLADPVSTEAVPDEIRQLMFGEIKRLNSTLSSIGGDSDPYGDVKDEGIRQQLRDLGYVE